MDDALKEDFCPYFGVAWEAGLGLAHFLETQTNLDLKNKTALEIGCGLALPSFVLKQKGSFVLACDFHDDVSTFLAHNQELNQIKFDYKKMNWRSGNLSEEKYDFVLGSDILYESNHPHFVAKTLTSFAKENAFIILSDPGRNYINSFLEAMNPYAKLIEKFSYSVETSWTSKDINIFIFKKI